MIKTGLIVGGGMFLLVLLVAAGIGPLCSPCMAVLAGLGAGGGAVWSSTIGNKNPQTPPQAPLV